jgi:hypothetical protein
MNFQFQLLTQLDGIRKNIKEEDIDRDKIYKWLLKTLQESSKPKDETLKDMDELYHKLFHAVLEEIHNLKLMGTLQIAQEIEYAFGNRPEEVCGSTKIMTKTAAAKALGISRSTLNVKVIKGIINTTIDGKIHEDEIIRYLSGK